MGIAIGLQVTVILNVDGYIFSFRFCPGYSCKPSKNPGPFAMQPPVFTICTMVK